jgi:hypothetical protein
MDYAKSIISKISHYSIRYMDGILHIVRKALA